MPAANTVKATEPPTVPVWFVGWVMMDGATGAGLTVNVATELVIDPTLLVTTTL